jgi:hypothetical protein
MALLNQNGQPVGEVKNSFNQDARHESKSEKFVPVRPEWGAEILNEYGYFLKSLSVGRAKKEENRNHQTTIATYQNETELQVGDIFPRITLKIPHIYGAIQAFAAFLRLSCKNGNAVRLGQERAPRIAHLGDALSKFETTVRGIVSYTEELNDSIREMKAREVTADQLVEFVKAAVDLRLGQNPNINSVQFQDLLTVRRQTDAGRDAFTNWQIVQEALMRYGFRYQVKTVSQDGIESVRNMLARPVASIRGQDTESVRSVDLNADLRDAALRILMGQKVA